MLFRDFEVGATLAQQTARAKDVVEQWPPDDLLGQPENEVVAYVTDRYTVDPPVLYSDRTEVVDQREVMIDVSGRIEYGSFDRSEPVHVPGQRIDVAVPFSGDPVWFTGRPDHRSSELPRGLVADDEVILVYREVNPDPVQLRGQIERDVAHLDTHVGWVRAMCERYNDEFAGQVREWIQLRKQRLHHQRNTAASIGLPVRRRDAEGPLLRVPVERRRVSVPRPTPMKGSSFVPEPELSAGDYEAALVVLESSRNTIERLARTTSRLTEEGIRDLLLVTLNGQFQGAAGGELFNGAGKTDILIRVDDRNVFIAECKFWKGQTSVTKALDQLLGYVVWRDTKAALLLFVRSGDATQIIDKAAATVSAHPNCKRATDDGEGSHRFVFASIDDTNREILLTLIPFVIRAADSGATRR